jgi:phosphoglycerate dehydrogenase-like enzyme
MTKVLFIWEIDSVLKNHLKKELKKFSDVKLVFPKDLSDKNLLKEGGNADIIIGWRPGMELLNNAEKLKLFIIPGTGVKHQINNFREINKTRKVVLANGHGHAYSTAQHTVAMLLSLMNRIVTHHNRMKDGIWKVSDNEDIYNASVQLKNRKIGLLGYGAINKNVHSFLSGFENEFHILRRSWAKKNDKLTKEIYKYSYSDLNNFLSTIDILIIAIPHTSSTENLIGEKELKLLGKTGLLVNVARGMVVNEKSLYDSLKDKIIAGAALDVWYNYSPEKDKEGKKFPFKFKFQNLKNVILSPHRAASPFDDLERWDEVIENIQRFNSGRKDFLNIVDLEQEY